MAKPLDRPAAVLPWLPLTSPLSIAQVQIVPRGELKTKFKRHEAAVLRKFLDCFAAPAPRGRLESIGNTVALVDAPPPTSDPDREAQIKRLRYVCDLLGAVIAGEMLSTGVDGEALKPYLLLKVPADAFAYWRPDGHIVGGHLSSYKVVRRPETAMDQLALTQDAHLLLQQLEPLIEDALSGGARADEIARSLHWFVGSHAFSLTARFQDTVRDLGTAFEILFGLSGKSWKGQGLRNGVQQMSQSADLVRLIGDLYKERNTVTHDGQQATPYLPDNHVSYLRLGQRLYWLCFRRTLERERQVAFPEFQDRCKALEWSMVSNHSRLTKLGALDPVSTATVTGEQAGFLDLLGGLHGNPLDRSGSPQLCQDALVNALKVLQHALSVTAQAQSSQNPLAATALIALASKVDATISDPNSVHPLAGETLELALLRDSLAGVQQPILHGHSFRELLRSDYVGGIADLHYRLSYQ